jgi:nucleotide-binding universal stress UspA family protein
MDHILVATDFSPRSDRALRRAAMIASASGASLTLLHVVDADRDRHLIDSERDAASAVLADAAATLKNDDGIAADWLVKVDDVDAGILSAAAEIAAELIVIGPQRNRLRDFFVGTTAERVLRRSTRPLLIAVGMPAAHHQSTLLALDFDVASKAAARKALEMGIFDQTKVVVMHAFDAPAEGMLKRAMDSPPDIERYVEAERQAAMDKLRALAKEIGLPPACRTVVSLKGSPARAILEAAQEAKCDLIALGTNQRKSFARVLIGSVAENVIRDAQRDVLIIPVDEAA